VYRQCGVKQNEFFCFTSGLSDTVTPKCPKCSQGNALGNAGVAGKPRSGRNPVENPKKHYGKTHQVVRTCQQQKLDLTGYIYRSRNDSADTRKLEKAYSMKISWQ